MTTDTMKTHGPWLTIENYLPIDHSTHSVYVAKGGQIFKATINKWDVDRCWHFWVDSYWANF